MGIKMVEVTITRNEMHKLTGFYAAWELPILEAAHQSVEPTGRELVSDREMPPTAEEFERLRNRYGRSRSEDGSIGLPYVEAVFGQHRAGLMALEAAMKEGFATSAPNDVSDLVAA